MAVIDVFKLGGIDNKSNDLIRPIDKASEMMNMEYDLNTSLKKRNGFGVFSTEDCDDFIYYSYKDEFLLFKNGSTNVVVMKKDGTFRTIPMPYGTPALQNVSISSTENQNNIYFTNTDFNTYVMKYDGSSVVRAGLMSPRNGSINGADQLPVYSTPATGFSRIFYTYKDVNGNITYSPYTQLAQSTPVFPSSPGTLSVSSFKTDTNSSVNGFYNKYAYRAKTGVITISSSQLTLNTTKHNYVAGDIFLMDTENSFITIAPNDRSFIQLIVESVVPNTSITFTIASVGANIITLADGSASYATEYPVDISVKVYIAYSNKESTGFTVGTQRVIDNSIVTNVLDLTLASDFVLIPTSGQLSLPRFEDIYDSTTLKIMPPICKFIGSFGNQIIYANILSYFQPASTSGLTNPNSIVNYANNDLFVYSDNSTGDGPEGVSELNFTKAGETWDGEITGVRRCNDSFVIFKNRGIFTIDGALVDGEFILRKLNTNFVGCTSHKSIVESDSGLMFQGHNGVYFTNGIGIKKLTYEVDDLLPSSNYLKTRAVQFKKKQKVLFFVEEISKIIVIDYYYNQIYLWEGILPTNGFVEDVEGNVFFAKVIDVPTNNRTIFKLKNDGEADQFMDNGVAIESYYCTTWHHAGVPSLNKKWLSFRFFALTDDAFDVKIETQGDWDSSKTLTTNDMSFSSTDQTKFVMLDMQTKRSMRIKLSNNKANQTMAITGYQITYEAFNNVDKN